MTQTDPEVIRRLTTAEQAVEDLVMPEITVDLISPFLQLPGLRLFVPTSGFDSAGNATDMSGLGHHLTYNGNPTYNDDGLAPYIDLDGTGDYLSLADHADFDILGTETYVAAKFKGLTIGGWFWADALQDFDSFFAKFTAAAGNRSYSLRMDTAANARASFLVSVDGTAQAFAGLPPVGSLTTATWHFIVGRFTPSLELALFFDKDPYLNIVGIPASIFNGNANLTIGADSTGASQLLDGRASCCFLCAAALLNATISALFESTKAAYGVD